MGFLLRNDLFEAMCSFYLEIIIVQNAHNITYMKWLSDFYKKMCSDIHDLAKTANVESISKTIVCHYSVP